MPLGSRAARPRAWCALSCDPSDRHRRVLPSAHIDLGDQRTKQSQQHEEQSEQQECEAPEDPANGRSRHECSRPISHLATGASGRCRSRGSSHPKQELSSADCGRTIRQLRHAQDQIAPTNQAMTRPTIAPTADRPGARCQAKNCSLGSPLAANTGEPLPLGWPLERHHVRPLHRYSQQREPSDQQSKNCNHDEQEEQDAAPARQRSICGPRHARPCLRFVAHSGPAWVRRRL